MPQRFLHLAWYRRHRLLIGYLILAGGVFIAIGGVVSHADDKAAAIKYSQQRILHQSCVSAKETRGPLIDYLDSQIDVTNRARKLGLFNSYPIQLRRLQNESFRNLKHLLGVYKERQGEPCPPAPS